MRGRAAWFGVLPLCALAQWQIFLVEGGAERPAAGVVDLGTIDASDRLETQFRVRNAGAASALLQTLAVAGAGFWLGSAPALPVTIPGGGALEFSVRFEPGAPGSYSAVLAVNSTTLIVRAVAAAGPVLWLEQEGQRVKPASGSTVDFGALEPGATRSRRFLVENPWSSAALMVEVAVSGAAFRGPVGIGPTLELAPGKAASFEVVFQPGRAGPEEGRLSLNGRVFRLAGVGLEPPLPKPRIVLDPAAPRSGQQVRVAIRLDSAAGAAAQGELRVRLEPAAAGAPDDPAVGFLGPVGRVVPFTVEPGAETARFAGRGEIELQTGTTAGKLILTARLGPHSEEAAVALAALPVAIDALRAARSGGGLELNLTGFDNTRSASRVAFTFYDREGRVLEPGTIAVEAGAEFRRYFEGSALGGVFALRAVFPVSGDAGRVAGVEVEIANSAGAARAPRVSF
jgi:hypothetical protein